MTGMDSRYWFARGYKTRQGAEASLEDSYASGEVSEGEGPRIESYKIRTMTGQATRYGITLNGN